MKQQVNNATGELIKVSLLGLFSWKKKKKNLTQLKITVYGSIIVALLRGLRESEFKQRVFQLTATGRFGLSSQLISRTNLFNKKACLQLGFNKDCYC